MPDPRKFMRLPLFKSLLAAAALLTAAGMSADEKPYALTDATSDQLSQIQPLLDKKDPTAALAIIDKQLGKVPADGYDAAIMLQIKAQILLQNNQQREGMVPLEKCLEISDAHTPPYFEERISQEFVYFLAQLYYQEVGGTKDKQKSDLYFDKAESYMRRWTKHATKLTSEPLLFYASLLYNRATMDAAHIDKERMKESLYWVDKALTLDTRPKDNAYLLKLACLLQMERYADSADILELLLSRQPNHRSYWEQLASIYLNLDKPTLAVVTYERAQAHGFMNSPRDNFNLVGIYFNIGQFEKASELLETGLKNGSIENVQKNWELLSYSYQQLHRDFKSIDALSRAVKAIPKSGQLEYMLAQGYYGVDKPADAIPHAQAAIQKGGLAKPGQVDLFLAYLCFSTKKFDEALEAVTRAMNYPDSAQEGKRMKSAIEDSIKEREAKLKNT